MRSTTAETAVQIPTHRDFFGGRFAVHIDERSLDVFRILRVRSARETDRPSGHEDAALKVKYGLFADLVFSSEPRPDCPADICRPRIPGFSRYGMISFLSQM
jgi:hypothetical protein